MKIGNIVIKTHNYWHGWYGQPIPDTQEEDLKRDKEDKTIGEFYIIIGIRNNGQSPNLYQIAKLNDFEKQSAWWTDDNVEYVCEGYAPVWNAKNKYIK